MSDDYMNPDLGKGRDKYKKEAEPIQEVVEETVIETRWKVDYYINYIDPQPYSFYYKYKGQGFPPDQDIIREIQARHKHLSENSHMIKLTKVIRVHDSIDLI